jgi:hypothetical protein
LQQTIDNPNNALSILKDLHVSNTPKYTHKITNPYALIPFILGAGAATAQQDNKKYGGAINKKWLSKY